MAKEAKWSCAEHCGACCKLDPAQRQEALSALSQKEQALYLSMVAKDGWCRHFDKVYRKCNIYKNRPSFCDVKKFSRIFQVESKDFDQFAISCCKQQIRYLYGGRSIEMKNFVKINSSRNQTQ